MRKRTPERQILGANNYWVARQFKKDAKYVLTDDDADFFVLADQPDYKFDMLKRVDSWYDKTTDAGKPGIELSAANFNGCGFGRHKKTYIQRMHLDAVAADAVIRNKLYSYRSDADDNGGAVADANLKTLAGLVLINVADQQEAINIGKSFYLFVDPIDNKFITAQALMSEASVYSGITQPDLAAMSNNIGFVKYWVNEVGDAVAGNPWVVANLSRSDLGQASRLPYQNMLVIYNGKQHYDKNKRRTYLKDVAVAR